MSLGSIAHLQYYFARTGILDGKGGQLAKDTRKSSASVSIPLVIPADDMDLQRFDDIGIESTGSPAREDDSSDEWDSSLMLPPTVSTYSHKTHYIAPPPDAATLRKDLQDGLAQVTQAVAEVSGRKKQALTQDHEDESVEDQSQNYLSKNQSLQGSSPSQGWHQLEGMHILDVVTLAIRSAKIYYTMHEHPQRLAIIKSERQIREELLSVLDVLKRMAMRNFAGGLKDEELLVVTVWVQGVEDFLDKEKNIEEREARDREKWQWLEGDWVGRDRTREWLFMSTFFENDHLPEWTSPSEAERLPTPFLEALRNGLTLVNLHNRILKQSKRQFGEIKTFHTDTAKPYRAAENIRYWIKAAEIRWEIKLQVKVMGVVYGQDEDVWREFDTAILAWCRAVREEITKEWKQGSMQVSAQEPNI
ncbi:hypothetical protein MMC13_001983 [Lambiella insularis]|nr:hypothetical protein [Lambiella insularis]